MTLLKWPASSRGDNNPEGKMPLREHIRELRNRILKAFLAIGVAAGIGFFFFDPIWKFLTAPFYAQANCKPDGAVGINDACSLVVSSIFEGFFLNLKIALIVGLVGAAPIWLYQLWAFVAPGLHRNERKWTYVFIAAAVPLFLAGAILAYLVLDIGLMFLLGFVPDNVATLPGIDSYLSFALTLLLVFGLTFELPLFVVILNLAGILTHDRLKRSRRWIIFSIFVFSAIVTPQDPISMIALALPTIGLFLLAETLAYFTDRRRARLELVSEHADILQDTAALIDEPLDHEGDRDGPEDEPGRK